MTSWDGHKAATSTALIQLLTSAQTGRTKFSQSQRALFTACEFWAASQNHSLSSHLEDCDLEQHLLAAELSFGLVGLPMSAAILMRARMTLAKDSGVTVNRVLRELERELLRVDERIDHQLEQFAKSGLAG